MRLSSAATTCLIFLSSCLTNLASAEVLHAEPHGFAVSHEVRVEADAGSVFAALVTPSRWWNSDHTWSGDAANLTLDPKPHGWFAEKMPNNGFVRHMEVIAAEPGKMLRMSGALGPLQEHAVTGKITFVLTTEGDRTHIKVTYSVGGYFPGGLKSLAPVVDSVIVEQATRLADLFPASASAE